MHFSARHPQIVPVQATRPAGDAMAACTALITTTITTLTRRVRLVVFA
jgi:hypothetical protein